MNKFKKVFRVLVIIGVIIGLAVGAYCGYHLAKNFIKDIIRDRERINSKTLTEYVKTHDYGYVDSSNELLHFYAQDIKCSDLSNKKVLAFYNDYLILDDYSVYKTTFSTGKYFSNEEQCKKIETNLKFKAFKKNEYNYYFISEDNKLYSFYDDEFHEEMYPNFKVILLSDEITAIARRIFEDDDIKVHIEVVKSDGNLYKQTYEVLYKDSKTTYNLLNEEMVLSSDKYGKILDIEYSNYVNIGMGAEKDLKEQIIRTLITDNGMYHAKYFETEKCKKYEDVECEIKLVKSDIYNKFFKDIKFIDTSFVFTNDNYIITTDTLMAELDKEHK